MNKYLSFMLSFATASLLTACGATSSSSTGTVNSSTDSPTQYCRSVGGKVKTVSSGRESFCLLPGGDVVKLQEFYDNNH